MFIASLALSSKQRILTKANVAFTQSFFSFQNPPQKAKNKRKLCIHFKFVIQLAMSRDIFKYGFSNLWITEKQGFANSLKNVTNKKEIGNILKEEMVKCCGEGGKKNERLTFTVICLRKNNSVDCHKQMKVFRFYPILKTMTCVIWCQDSEIILTDGISL